MNNSRLWLIITQVFKKEDVDEDKGEDEEQVETKGKRGKNKVKTKENSKPKRQRRLIALLVEEAIVALDLPRHYLT